MLKSIDLVTADPLLSETTGVLKPGYSTPVGPAGEIKLSNLVGGSAESIAQPSMSIKYVAAGVEVYAYGGVTYRVAAAQFLLLPENHQGEAGIDRRAGEARGMCVYLPHREPAPAAAASRLEAPVVFSARCSELGRLLASSHQALTAGGPRRAGSAAALLGHVERHIEPFVADAMRSVDALSAVKPAKRYELLRRLEVARAYLHAVTDRAVALHELARAAGMSRFHLARLFSEAFGEAPASYHRRIRVELARSQLESERMTCTEAALSFGFADAAHFSRAFKRLHGSPPTGASRSGTPATPH